MTAPETDFHQRLKDVFLAVVELSPGEREQVLDELCDSDRALRDEVLALLAADADGTV